MNERINFLEIINFHKVFSHDKTESSPGHFWIHFSPRIHDILIKLLWALEKWPVSNLQNYASFSKGFYCMEIDFKADLHIEYWYFVFKIIMRMFGGANAIFLNR